MRAVAK